MIKVEYVYDNEVIASYVSGQYDSRTILIPRQDEFVELDGIDYRVETVKHKFSSRPQMLGIIETEQHVGIKLTRHR